MNEFNYELLETARLLRQKTQKEVSAATGISQASLSKAEHGLQALPDEAMRKLSDYYDFPVKFFTRRAGFSPVGHLYFRRKLTIPNKVIDSFTAKVEIYKSIVDVVMSAVEVPEYTLGSYIPGDDLSPKEIADKVRYKMGIYRGEVHKLAALLECNGVLIIRFDFGTDKIDGLTTVTDNGRKVMLINSEMPSDRIRFSLAHELGHLVMHIGNPPSSPEAAEEEADDFASEFLMPKDDIFPMLSGLKVSTLPLLKRKWGVSMHAITRRARDLGAISQKEYRNIQIYFSKMGYTKNEPVMLPVETPSVWVDTLGLYRNELEYSDNDLMNMMYLNERDFKSWFAPRAKIAGPVIMQVIKTGKSSS